MQQICLKKIKYDCLGTHPVTDWRQNHKLQHITAGEDKRLIKTAECSLVKYPKLSPKKKIIISTITLTVQN